MKTIEAYKTSDGKLFEDEAKAQTHQLDIIGELLDTLLPDTGGNITRIDRHRLLMAALENPKRDALIRQLYQAVTHTDD